MPQKKTETAPPLPPGYVDQEWGSSSPGNSPETYPTPSQWPAQIGIGAGKGALSTLDKLRGVVAGDSVKKTLTAAGRESEPNRDTSFQGIGPIPPSLTTPSNLPQRFGRFAEGMGEYALGGAAAHGATSGMGLLGRMAGQGVAGAAVSGLHGGSPEEMAGTGITASMMPLAFRVLRGLATSAEDTVLGRLISRYLSKSKSGPIDAEFVPGPEPYNTPGPVMDAEVIPKPTPPTQVGGRDGMRLQITGETTKDLPKLNKGPGFDLPKGTEGAPIEPDPRLPKKYASEPVAGKPSPPATGGGKVSHGEEGGIKPHGEQTITGVKPKPVREPGDPNYRKGTAEDLAKQKGNAGRTVRETPKPTPPKKAPKK